MRFKNVVLLLLSCSLMLSACKSQPKMEEPKWELLQQNAVTFADGNHADLWAQEGFPSSYKYRLADGTDLLNENIMHGPDRVYVVGQESLDDLGEEAQQKIIEYYQQRGLLYDIENEVKRAYDEYLRCKKENLDFSPFMAAQSVSPTASNDNIMCFLTSVMLSIDSRIGQELRYGDIFDRKTGERIDELSIFSISEVELKERFGELFGIKDRALAAEMTAALKSEYITVFPGSVSIDFPQGVLPSQQYSYIVSAEFTELGDAVNSWAIIEDNRKY